VSMSKLQARRMARLYAAEQLRQQDTPAWAIEHGVIDGADIVFMDELQRIADRLERSAANASGAIR
jgi:hypothetical protein